MERLPRLGPSKEEVLQQQQEAMLSAFQGRYKSLRSIVLSSKAAAKDDTSQEEREAARERIREALREAVKLRSDSASLAAGLVSK